MNLRYLLSSAAFVSLLLPAAGQAQTRQDSNYAPQSPYGGTVIEEIITRVNDRIITRSDYDRAEQQLESEARQQGWSQAEIDARKKNMLRDLIDQQLWLSKGKELNITGDTEVIRRLDEIRKRNNMGSMEELEQAAKKEGISFEDFKATIRDSIVTQMVMREEVGRRVQITPGEAQRYYEAHKDEMAAPESVRLSEILVSTNTAAPSATDKSEPAGPDQATVAAARAKADDVEKKLQSGENFETLARTMSDGSTAKQGGDLGNFRRGSLAKELEEKTFALKAGEYTSPIRTRQGWIILKVTQHVPGGVPSYDDVANQVQEAVYMSKMEPALRDYLTKTREESYIDIKPGYVDTAASSNETKPVYSAYQPPAPKKKRKVERTRFRDRAKTVKATTVADQVAKPAATVSAKADASQPAKAVAKQQAKGDTQVAVAGKKEKIRFGKAPRESLPAAGETRKEDAGAAVADNANADPNAPEVAEDQPQEAPAPKPVKTRFSDHATDAKPTKAKTVAPDPLAPVAASADEVATRQTQSSPLGLAGDTATKKKKKKVVDPDAPKTRYSDKAKPASDASGSDAVDQPAPAAPAPDPAATDSSTSNPPATDSPKL